MAWPPVGDNRFSEAPLERLVADARSDELIAARGRERWLRRQASEDATIASVLVASAERSLRVVVTVRGGSTVAGVVDLVGSDVVGLVAGDGRRHLVAGAHVVTVRCSGAGVLGDDGGGRDRAEVTLRELLHEVAATGRRVRLATVEPGTAIAGELCLVGRDVIGVAPEPGTVGGDVVYVRLASVAAASFNVSG